MTKFVFVTGGVISSIGKGILSASLGSVLQERDLRVTALKLDPYLNVDPGTMNPFQHGEVFVTADGSETDLDLGHYERFTSNPMSRINSFTSGQVYQSVIDNERQGKYNGGTVQVVPHVVDEIKQRIYASAQYHDIAIVEIGGTVGDIESLPFVEAIRQIKLELPDKHTVFIHLTYVPYVPSAGEIKTKPTQHSIKDMRSLGLQPDILVCRSQHVISDESLNKISLFTNVNSQDVISFEDVKSIYYVPLLIKHHHLDEIVLKKISLLPAPTAKLNSWKHLLHLLKSDNKTKLKVGIVGKYIKLKDAYLSLFESLTHAAIHQLIDVEIIIINSDQPIELLNKELREVDAIVVPGGFGKRGIDGKVNAIRYARTNKIPFLGICLGMQLAIIEYARHVCRVSHANSTEFHFTTVNPIISLIGEHLSKNSKTDQALGGTLRLGAQNIHLNKNSLIAEIYGKNVIVERHRHRYEFNNEYTEKLEQGRMIISGKSADGLLESVELPRQIHPWFVACQFHPEFTSNPLTAHPLFLSFMKAAKDSL